ncbi:hypothetical protein DPSP01_012620 [Paraphaeosphaeria sporulosa]
MENAQETILRLQEAVKQQARAIDTIRQEQKDTVAENDALHQKTLDWSRRFPVLEDQNRKLLKKNKTKDDEIQRLRAQTAHLAQLLALQGAGVESVKEEVKDARQDIATTAQGDGTPSDRSSTKALRDVETQMEKLTVDEAEELPHTHLHAMAGAGRHADMRKALEPLLGVDITDEVCSRICDVVMEIIGPELAKANAQLSDCVARWERLLGIIEFKVLRAPVNPLSDMNKYADQIIVSLFLRRIQKDQGIVPPSQFPRPEDLARNKEEDLYDSWKDLVASKPKSEVIDWVQRWQRDELESSAFGDFLHNAEAQHIMRSRHSSFQLNAVTDSKE